MSLKGQAAIEYLTTYGWMILAVGLVGGTVYTQLPQPCNFEASIGSEHLMIENMGVTQRGELAVSFRRSVPEEVVIQQAYIKDNQTLYSNETTRIERTGTPIRIGNVERTQDCQQYQLQVEYDKGVIPDIKKSTTLRLPITLDKVLQPYLTIKGGNINSLSSSSTFRATNSDICIGGRCPDNLPKDDNREKQFVNRSGDQMQGTLEVGKLDWECIGGNCGVEQGSLKGYVSEENNTIDGTLNLTEIKPYNNLCLGQC